MVIFDSNDKTFYSYEEFERFYLKKAKKVKSFLQGQELFIERYKGSTDFKLLTVHFVVFDGIKQTGILSCFLDDFNDVSSGITKGYIFLGV